MHPDTGNRMLSADEYNQHEARPSFLRASNYDVASESRMSTNYPQIEQYDYYEGYQQSTGTDTTSVAGNPTLQ